MTNEKIDTSVEIMMKKCFDTFFPDESMQKDMTQFMETFFGSLDKDKMKNIFGSCPCGDFNSKKE